MIDYILMDIEGTTTSIDFVHKTLFPYAKKHLASYVAQNSHKEEVLEQLSESAREFGIAFDGKGSFDEVVLGLLSYMDEDKKYGPLKALQGMIWEDGYASGAFKGHIYEDVPACWTEWREKGLRLGIYSSGSVKAQKLLFGHTEFGDLNPFIDAYFDTKVGGKKEKDSYVKILGELGLDGEKVLFLSDINEELDAAKLSGFQTMQLLRKGAVPAGGHRQVRDFREIGLF